MLCLLLALTSKTYLDIKDDKALQLQVRFENQKKILKIDLSLTSVVLLCNDCNWHSEEDGQVFKNVATDPINKALNSFPLRRSSGQYRQGLSTERIPYKITIPDGRFLPSQQLAVCLLQLLPLPGGMALRWFTRKLGCTEVLVCH